MFAGGASVCFALCLPRVENAKRRLSRVVIRDKPSRTCALLPRNGGDWSGCCSAEVILKAYA